MALYPALQVVDADHELALAAVDDAEPLAAEATGDALTIFFPTSDRRAQARAALAATLPAAILTDRDIDDEDWARRSQENLGPIVVGRITVRGSRLETDPSALVIQPSMGFGTGHHATTRLCLAALQRLDLTECDVLDVGTGSGILALAARALGAARAFGVDCDPDAIRSAEENIGLNPSLTATGAVQFARRDLNRDALPESHVVTANLTGALLCRTAPVLMRAVSPGGHLILSGILAAERDEVVSAFSSLPVTWEARDEEWIGLCFNRPIRDTV